MCWKCNHDRDVMCSCRALNSGRKEEMAAHFLTNLRGMKLELSYNTLVGPAPYCLCAAGTCKVCGKRLCMSVEMPAYLTGEGFLAVVLHHAARLELKLPGQFLELFHEEDRPAVRHWLEELKNPNSKNISSEQETAATVYTIVQTAMNTDKGFFPDPFSWGSYLSLDQARECLTELVEAAKKDLSDRYNKEDTSDDHWEAYEDGCAAGCFIRIEILTSKLFPARKGRSCHA